MTFRIDAIVSLARHAAMSTSYKPALLKAIVRCVRREARREIPLVELGSEFVRLYWVQTVVFRLRQAPSLARESEIVRAIRGAAEREAVRDLGRLTACVRERLDRDMARILTINVLRAFHGSKPPDVPDLFAWGDGHDRIAMTDDAVAFVRAHSATLEAIANLWWARYLERVNMSAPKIIEKVERLGAKRSPLGRYLDILRRTDGSFCFYCDRELDERASVQIDHVIPWSFLLSDPLWDLVLACASCNGRKSDTLPTRAYLDKLDALGGRRAKLALPGTFASPFLSRHELDRFYDAALGVEWPSGWNPLGP